MDSFDLQSAAFHRNPYPTLARLLAEGPVIPWRMPLLGKIHWATSFEAASDFLKGADRFAADGRNAGKPNVLGVRWLPGPLRVLTQNMLLMDEPDHRRLRKLVDAPFRKGWIDAYRPAIATIADRLLDGIEARGERDVVPAFARALPLEVICEILGLRGDRRQFMGWMANFGGAMNAWMLVRVVPTIRKLTVYLRQEIDRARIEQQPCLLTEIVNAEADGERMTDDEMMSMLILLFVAGHETTTHLLSTGIHALLTHRDQLELLKTDRSLMPQAVEEILRYCSPVQATKPRMAREDMDFHGARLKRGDKVMAMLASANVDPAAFDDPLRFDILRQSRNRHVGFGGGLHICLGMHLARAESQIALERLFARWPDVRLAVPDGELPWQTRLGMHGLASLPLAWT